MCSLIILVTIFLTYSFYLYWSLPVEKYTTSDDAKSGKLIWQRYNCNACHQVYGLGGYLGPDLTNVYSMKGADYIKVFLVSGTNVMPDFHLSDKEITEVIAYLKNIDASGISDPRTFTINTNGTIKQ